MAELRGTRDLEIADRVFGALSHPTRRQILLSVHHRGTATAGELARRFDCSWPTTSRHLSTLVERDLLRVEQRGRERIYSANSALLRRVLAQWARYFEPAR